ncbi:MAG: hypothetical protein PHQ34_03530, partial [Methanothrix sp.]|nr:hypothetical protein [Methanothrix sp.]
ELFGDDKRITISDVQLTSNGEQAHKDLLKYYIENIHNGEFVDPKIVAEEQPAKEEAKPSSLQPDNQDASAASSQTDSEVAENLEAKDQSAESSTDIKQGSEPNALEMEKSQPEDESNVKEGSKVGTLNPVTNPPPDEELLLGISRDLDQFSQEIAPSAGQFKAKDFKKGDEVVTTDLLNVRSEPGLPADSAHDTRISEAKGKGSTGIILNDQPIYADGFAWWKIQYDDGTIGWSQDKRLELQQIETQETVQQEKQPETQDTLNAKFGPYSEDKNLEAEAFREASAKERTGLRALHSATSPPSDESSTDEGSEVRTLHPAISPPPAKTPTESNELQVSGTDLSDYTFLRDDKESSNLKWAVKGSGDKGRPAYQEPATAAGFQDNAQQIQAQPSSSTDRANSNGNSIVGEWNVIQITTPHELFGGSIQIQFMATFGADGSVSRPRQQQGKMWIDASTGSWTQNGDRIRWTIAEVTHEGTIQGNKMSGVIYSSGGKSSWSAEKVR